MGLVWSRGSYALLCCAERRARLIIGMGRLCKDTFCGMFYLERDALTQY